ncbi:MAG TPA: Gfo/Idh/MocA family oxidoreductase [Chloroflexota bacterium]|nr:Gfo/Idh/MocA family oxidoreductase [Chloroflexota bacterium]
MPGEQHFLGVAVWGTGWVAGEHLRAFARNEHTRVIAVGSRTRDGARKKLAEVGLGADEIAVHDDLDALLADDRVQIVSICTPNYLHAANVIQAARAGKHLVIEKPPAIDLASLRAMRDAVRDAGVRTIVSFVLRWNPLVNLVKSLREDGTLGEVVFARADYWHRLRAEEWGGYHWAHRREGGGSAMLAGGSHAVDALRHLVGSEVVSVSARHGPVRPASGFEWPGTTVALLEFANGALAEVSACLDANLPYVFNLEVLGERGSLRGNRLYAERLAGQTDWAEIPTILPDSGDVAHHPFQDEIDHFVASVLAGREASPNLHDAVRTTAVCLAADLAAAERRTVTLPLPGLED